jgi:glyoxylase-like metal-dependent hydrolase (beta-lactamase superfamily II)
VAPGVRRLRMPLPFALDHTNLWLLDDEDGWTLGDCGIATAEVRSIWRRLYSERFADRPLRRLICAHFHPDHMGLAGWLCDHWQIELWASLAEWAFGRMLVLEGDARFVDRAVRRAV